MKNLLRPNETIEFLRHIWPDTGVFYLATRFVKDGRDMGTFAHYAMTSPEQAADFIAQKSTSVDVWHTYSAFKATKVVGADGKARKRVHDNLLSGRSLVWDVDLGGDRGHSTVDEALTDISRFCEDSGVIPPSDIVLSGGGLHLYWVLDTVLTPDGWQKCAARLKAAAMRYGGKLAADVTRIADMGGLLRPVGSANHKDKYGTPRLVTWHQRGERIPVAQMVGCLKGVELPPSAPSAAISDRVFTQDPNHPFAALVKLVKPPRTQVDFDELRAVCKHTQRYYESNGNLSEPDWFAFAQLMTYVKNGREIFHQISSGDPRYSFEDAEAKFNRAWEADLGPPHYSHLDAVQSSGTGSESAESAFSELCNSPIAALAMKKNQLSPEPVEQEVPVGHTAAPATDGNTDGAGDADATSDEGDTALIPTGYSIATGAVMRWESSEEDGTGHWVKICDHIMYLEDITDPTEAGGASQTIVKSVQNLSTGEYISRSVEIPSKHMASAPEFFSAALERGLPVGTTNARALFTYLSACRDMLMRNRRNLALTEQFGWSGNSNFTTGNEVITAKGQRPVRLAPAIAPLQKFIGGRKGDLESWKNIFNVYVDGFKQSHASVMDTWGSYMAIAMTGFAAPLMRMTGQRCLTISVEGDSGIGKSAALRLASSVWGAPNENITKASDTANYREAVLGAMGSLPIYYDEVTVEDNEYLREFIMKVTQGQGRNRLTATAMMKTSLSEWHTLIVMSSNKEVSRAISDHTTASNAERYRLLPVLVKRSPMFTPAYMREVFRDLDNHHGLAGSIFANFLVRNYEDVQRRVLERMDIIERDGPDTQGAGRFWAAGLAAIVVAAEITEELGLSRAKAGLLAFWAAQQFDQAAKGVKQDTITAASVLNKFVSENLGRLVQVQEQGGHTILCSDAKMRGVIGRVSEEIGASGEYISRTSYVASSEINRVLQERALNVSDAVRSLRQEGILRAAPLPVNITRGTPLVPTTLPCYEFDHDALTSVVNPASKGAQVAEA